MEESTGYSRSRVQPYKEISSSRAQGPEDFYIYTDVLQYENTKQGILAAPSNLFMPDTRENRSVACKNKL